MLFDNVVCGGPSLKVPGHLSFGQHVLDRIRENCQREDNVAMINGDTGHKTTYKHLLQDIVNIATGLTNMGIKKGDVVALYSENRMEYMTTVLGAICCGATVTTINVLYTKDEVIHVLEISRPSVIFCSEASLKLNLNLIRSVSCIKRIIQLDGIHVASDIVRLSSVALEADVRRFKPAPVHGCTDVVLIPYSSGTTGLPKGVMLTHLNLLYIAASLDYGYTREKCPIILSILPWYHVFGLITTMHYLTCNKLIVYMSGFNPEKYFKAIEEYQVNFIIVVPPIVVFLAKSELVQKFDLSSIESLWYGAAPLSLETANAALKRLPNCKTIVQVYGMTETTLAAIKDSDNINAKPGARPLPGITVKVVNVETREKQGPYQKGEVCIKGPSLMKGYAGSEAATRAMFDDEGYLKTGDIGYYDEDGCFFIIDRLKELIKYKGHQVAPAAVESVILQHNGVAECGVVGTPDEHAGELPTAFVVAKPGARLTELDLLNFTAARLSPVARLRGGVIFVDEIPKNPSGKILRRVLRQRLHLRSKIQ